MENADPSRPIKNILVTGGAGFIGSHVVRRLVTLYPEYTIFNFDKLEYCSSLKSLNGVDHLPNYCFIQGDLTSTDFVKYVLKEKKIDTIIHFAAQSHVDNSFGDSFDFTKVNVMGTHVLLEAARVHRVKRFIHISTDEVYGEISSDKPDCDEAAPLHPTNPYAATKAAAEHLVNAYYKSFGLPIIITRSNNIYGPFQYPEKVIPKFISLLLRSRKCTVHGDGLNSRHYLYATDLTAALDTILHRGVIGETYNIGTNFEISNLALARMIYKGIKSQNGATPEQAEDDAYLEFVEDRAFNDRRYAIDSSKIRELGWTPTVSFEDGLSRTIAWYQENSEHWWGDITDSLVAHPFRQYPTQLVVESPDYNIDGIPARRMMRKSKASQH
ncbi:hypothetical protein BJ742DRAFT_677543 [Cladochytrium replicatum]|nr:hypothetical protein BJ742DRAFT_677543 [Cladochytrium replicatum]